MMFGALWDLPEVYYLNLAGVYFIQAGEYGRIKIGVSKQLGKRVRTLQLACPYPLKVVGHQPDYPEDIWRAEEELHRQFESIRVCGEWFIPSHQLADYIKALYSPPEQYLD